MGADGYFLLICYVLVLNSSCFVTFYFFFIFKTKWQLFVNFVVYMALAFASQLETFLSVWKLFRRLLGD